MIAAFAFPIFSAQAQTSPEMLAREYANVVYLMIINGQEGYNQSDQKYRMIIGLDLVYRKVTNAYNINAGNFESSIYKLETNKDKILKYVENGGIYGNYLSPEAAKTINIQVGKPKQGLIITWQWNPEACNSSEIFVPGLIFPLAYEEGQMDYYRTNLVVPLTGDFLSQNNDIKPMPLEEKPL